MKHTARSGPGWARTVPINSWSDSRHSDLVPFGPCVSSLIWDCRPGPGQGCNKISLWARPYLAISAQVIGKPKSVIKHTADRAQIWHPGHVGYFITGTMQKSPQMALTENKYTIRSGTVWPYQFPITALSDPRLPDWVWPFPDYSLIISEAVRSGFSRAVCFIPDLGFLAWAQLGPQ